MATRRPKGWAPWGLLIFGLRVALTIASAALIARSAPLQRWVSGLVRGVDWAGVPSWPFQIGGVVAAIVPIILVGLPKRRANPAQPSPTKPHRTPSDLELTVLAELAEASQARTIAAILVQRAAAGEIQLQVSPLRVQSAGQRKPSRAVSNYSTMPVEAVRQWDALTRPNWGAAAWGWGFFPFGLALVIGTSLLVRQATNPYRLPIGGLVTPLPWLGLGALIGMGIAAMISAALPRELNSDGDRQRDALAGFGQHLGSVTAEELHRDATAEVFVDHLPLALLLGCQAQWQDVCHAAAELGRITAPDLRFITAGPGSGQSPDLLEVLLREVDVALIAESS